MSVSHAGTVASKAGSSVSGSSDRRTKESLFDFGMLLSQAFCVLGMQNPLQTQTATLTQGTGGQVTDNETEAVQAVGAANAGGTTAADPANQVPGSPLISPAVAATPAASDIAVTDGVDSSSGSAMPVGRAQTALSGTATLAPAIGADGQDIEATENAAASAGEDVVAATAPTTSGTVEAPLTSGSPVLTCSQDAVSQVSPEGTTTAPAKSVSGLVVVAPNEKVTAKGKQDRANTVTGSPSSVHEAAPQETARTTDQQSSAVVVPVEQTASQDDEAGGGQAGLKQRQAQHTPDGIQANGLTQKSGAATEQEAGASVNTQATAAVHAGSSAVTEPARGDATAATTTVHSVVRQIMQQAHLFTRAGQSGLEVRLEPETLGSLHVKVTVDSSGMAVQVTTHSDITTRLIEAGLPLLRSALADQGLHVSDVQVATAQSQLQSDSQPPWSQGQRDEVSRGWSTGRLHSTEVDSSGPVDGRWWEGSRLVDLRI